MVTRMYLSRDSAPFSPTVQGSWDDAASITRAKLSQQKSTLASNSLQKAETSTDPAWDVHLTQFVSDALDTAQTISGTFDLCVQGLETNADADMFLHIHAWVTQGDTSTPRGTLLTDFIDASEFATTETGIQIPQQTLTGVAASVGDRIVVEVGYRATNVTASSRTGRIRHGGNAATDLTSGDTDQSHPSWCEFGTTITDAETRVAWQSKWYLGGGSQDAIIIPPIIRGGWTVISSAGVALSDQLRTATPGVASATIGLSTGATTQNLTRLLRIFVSPPLNAGTIPASLFHITGLTLEAATDQDIVWSVHLYLMAKNGDVRATLLNLQADATTANEWPITTPTGRQSDGFAITSQAISQDDRLVLEVGGKQLGTPAAAGTITIRQGGTGADAAAGDTDTTKPTWFGLVANATGRTYVVMVG